MLNATYVDPNVGTGYVDNGFYEEPIQPTPVVQAQEESADDLTKQFSAMFNAFADSIPNGSQEQKTGKSIFKRFADYVSSKNFENDLNEKSEKYKIPKKQLAKNFFLKVLGIIGDVLGIVIGTVCNIVDTAVTLLSTLLHTAVTAVNRVANGIASAITLNQTACEY